MNRDHFIGFCAGTIFPLLAYVALYSFSWWRKRARAGRLKNLRVVVALIILATFLLVAGADAQVIRLRSGGGSGGVATAVTPGVTTVTGCQNLVLFGDASQLLNCDADLGFLTDTLTVTKIGSTTLTGTNVATGRTTFGTAADAANAVDAGETAGRVSFEGSTADAFETRFGATDPTVGDGVILLPNLAAATTDTLVTLALAQTLTNKTLTSPTLTTPAIGVASGTSATLSSLTSGRVATVGTAGLLQDDADLTFSGTRTTTTDLTVTNFPTFSAGTATRVPFFGVAGVVTDDADMTFATDTLTTTNHMFGSGVIGTPSIGWSADNDGTGTGFYRPNANQIGVVNDGALRWLFNSTAYIPNNDLASTFGAAANRLKDIFTGNSLQGGNTKTLTETTATEFVRVAVPQTAGANYAGGTAIWTAYASDGTDSQSIHGESKFSAVNKAGTETCSAIIDSQTLVAASAGTLTCTITCVTGLTDLVGLAANCTSSLVQTTLSLVWSVSMAKVNTVTPQ